MSCPECLRLAAENAELKGALRTELAAVTQQRNLFDEDRKYYKRQCLELINELNALKAKL